MHETDIARTRNQVNKVADKAQAVVDEVDALTEAGFDPTQSNSLARKQEELVVELAQAIADFNELTNRAETVELEPVTYAPQNAFEFTHDTEADTVTITYTGTVDLADVKVEKAGTEITPFSLPLSKDGSVAVDISTLADGETITITYESTRDVTPVPITPWDRLTGDTAPEITLSGVDVPAHQLIPETRTQTETFYKNGPTGNY